MDQKRYITLPSTAVPKAARAEPLLYDPLYRAPRRVHVGIHSEISAGV